MKRFLLIIAVAAMALSGCKKIEESIDATNARIDKLEQAVPSIEEQISSIQESINALEEVDSKLKESIKALEASDKATAEEIAALKDADKAIEAKIEELKKYVDDVLKSTKDWVSATFATLEQLNALSGEVAALKSLVDANKAEAAANLANAISNLETSLKKWVGEQLSNYYTIAQIDAKIAELQKTITDGDSALQQQLNELKSQLETAKAELTDAYKKAIKEAIETNNGVIEGKIAEAVAAVNQRIDSEVETINAKISAIEARLNNIEAQVKDLLARIQSVSYVPQYSDGKALVTCIGAVSEVILDFKVSPKECVAELEKVWSEALSCEAVYTKTRAVSLVKMAVSKFEADAENGIISITASGENLSEEFFAGTQEASVALVISDGNNYVTSEYVPMITKEITDEIWYKTTDGQPLIPNKEGVDIFGANIVSNTYNEESGWFVLKFDAPVTLIGKKAFGISAEGSASTLQEIVIPDSVTSIGDYAFDSCTSLTSVTIPDSVTSIGVRAFYDCTSLTSVTIPNGITKIENHTFFHCKALTNITLPANLEIIGTAAFQGCSSITSLTIPNSVTEIGEYALCNLGISSIVIPDGITSINNKTFFDCKNLASVTIPDSVTLIGSYAFQNCTSLASVTLPDSVTEIRERAFTNCHSLKEVYCKPITPPTAVTTTDMWKAFTTDCKIYVPRNSVEAYKSAEYWNGYADYIEGKEF